MIKPILLFIVGLVCLIKGGDWFVDGASAMARKFHLPELLIGATVVSIGTTLPEVMVSTMSALSGHGEIAYGNAIGSVICNTALIAAITIAVKPGPADPKTLRIPVAFFYIAAAIYCVAAYAMGRFTRTMGLIMLAVFAAYMVVNVRSMKSGAAAAQSDDKEDEPSEEDVPMPKILLLLVLGEHLQGADSHDDIAVGSDIGEHVLIANAGVHAAAVGKDEHGQRTTLACHSPVHIDGMIDYEVGQRKLAHSHSLVGTAAAIVGHLELLEADGGIVVLEIAGIEGIHSRTGELELLVEGYAMLAVHLHIVDRCPGLLHLAHPVLGEVRPYDGILASLQHEEGRGAGTYVADGPPLGMVGPGSGTAATPAMSDR